MQENTLEQQKSKIDAAREEMSGQLRHLFDEKGRLEEKVDNFILRLEDYEKDGLVFDKEAVIKGVREGVVMQDKEMFVSHLLKVMEPFIIIRATQPKIFEKIQRESALNDKKNIKLSEVLYISQQELNNEREEIYIHLPPSKDFMTKEKKEDFKQEIKKGLTKLAEIIKPYPNIKEIWASSWIIATPHGRKRLEDLGFTYAGMISEEERKEWSPEETRPIAKAFMNREDFLATYCDQADEVAWQRILSKFPEKLQDEFRIERPNPDKDDIEMFEHIRLLEPVPIEIPIEKLLEKNTDVVYRTPLDVFEEINQKYYQMKLDASGRHFHEQNPSRLREYSKMPAETADPSVLLDGEIWFGTGRFIAALLRGDKSLRVWNLSRK